MSCVLETAVDPQELSPVYDVIFILLPPFFSHCTCKNNNTCTVAACVRYITHSRIPDDQDTHHHFTYTQDTRRSGDSRGRRRRKRPNSRRFAPPQGITSPRGR
ncbi:hypothetical protein KP79_PYT20814 [Mizuhopecten yessoensis]|uniref:Uncharacterized protein n=1 Tax=Mizuhopecten yessoensis TaxID=6573 RepID=A0A210R1D7_MIZYE|nr:hypothetical protein KP79_PYT20814 [Mizuhopecten yessoensis]